MSRFTLVLSAPSQRPPLTSAAERARPWLQRPRSRPGAPRCEAGAALRRCAAAAGLGPHLAHIPRLREAGEEGDDLERATYEPQVMSTGPRDGPSIAQDEGCERRGRKAARSTARRRVKLFSQTKSFSRTKSGQKRHAARRGRATAQHRRPRAVRRTREAARCAAGEGGDAGGRGGG